MNNLTTNSSKIVKAYIKSYYDEYDPKSYKRTDQFRESVTIDDLRYSHDEWYSSVFIDYMNMHYTYFADEIDAYDDNGEMVVMSADWGYHGAEDFMGDMEMGTAELFKHSSSGNGNRFWSDSIVDIWNYEVMKTFKVQLEMYTGCNVTVMNGWEMGYER